MKPISSKRIAELRKSRGFSMIEVLVALLILGISFAGSTQLLVVLREASSQNASQYNVIVSLREQLRLNGAVTDLCTDGANAVTLSDGSSVTPTVVGCDEQTITIGGTEIAGFNGRLSLEVDHELLGGLVRVGGE